MTRTARDLLTAFSGLSTALVLDASLRLHLPLQVAPRGIRSLYNGTKLAGQVLPARHHGSVDVFLEAISQSRKGDVLVIDNKGRMDEACIGDLVTLEAQRSGLGGIIVWGCHRDTMELRRIRLPIFSCGSYPSGPVKLRKRPDNALRYATVGKLHVSRDYAVLGDDDGVVFVSSQNVRSVVEMALKIGETERRQARDVRRGKLLRDQLHLEEYTLKRSRDPSYTFRQHLRKIGGAVEE